MTTETGVASEEQPTQVRTWYGLSAEIVIGEELWHQVSAAGLPFPHPGLVNQHLRQGLPRRERKHLTYWHELGHLETFPLTIAHALLLWQSGRGRKDTPWYLRLMIGLLALMAGWEASAELYTMARAGTDYARLYRQARPKLPMSSLFWAGMGGLAVGGTLWLLGGRKGGGAHC